MLNIITIVLYLIAAGTQYLRLTDRVRRGKGLFLLCGYIAVILHGYLLHHWIDIGVGQNLTFFNLLSMVIWLVAALVLITSIRKPIESLCTFIFPLAAVSMILVMVFPGSYIINTAADPKQLFDILLSIFTVSVVCLAGLQAILLAIQEYLLRHKRAGGVIQQLPPLETMETLLFQMIWLAFILLTILMATTLYFYPHIVLGQFLAHSLLVIIAWIILALLLIGRYLFGWRARKAIYGTLIAVVLLICAYLGSHIMQEISGASSRDKGAGVSKGESAISPLVAVARVSRAGEI